MIRAIIVLPLLLSLVEDAAFGARAEKPKPATPKSTVAAGASLKSSKPKSSKVSSSKRKARKRLRSRQGWYKEPTYGDSTLGDQVDGEELEVRRAAVDALGPYNGTVVAVEPGTGRILTIVNQKLAFRSGFTPCSTIKLVTALAALNEGVVERQATLRISRRLRLDLDGALAHSNLSNGYFGKLGEKLGFERVTRYAQILGLGEKAGWNIEEEQAGILPEALPCKLGIMTAFGNGISLTPLELASIVSAVANGGTLHYLQYPRSQSEVDGFEPRIKRQLEFTSSLEDLKLGMRAAVAYGTGRRAEYDPNQLIFGKTGTCSDYRYSSHLGWFGSFAEFGAKKLVVVVLLTGGRMVNGPLAAEVAGKVYRNLSLGNYFTEPPVASASTVACCSQ